MKLSEAGQHIENELKRQVNKVNAHKYKKELNGEWTSNDEVEEMKDTPTISENVFETIQAANREIHNLDFVVLEEVKRFLKAMKGIQEDYEGTIRQLKNEQQRLNIRYNLAFEALPEFNREVDQAIYVLKKVAAR